MWSTLHVDQTGFIRVFRTCLARRAIDEGCRIAWDKFKEERAYPGEAMGFCRKHGLKARVRRGRGGKAIDYTTVMAVARRAGWPEAVAFEVDDPTFGKASFHSGEELTTWVRHDSARLWAVGFMSWCSYDLWGPVPAGTWNAILRTCANSNISPAEASLSILGKVIGLSPTRIRQVLSEQKTADPILWHEELDDVVAFWKETLARVRALPKPK